MHGDNMITWASSHAYMGIMAIGGHCAAGVQHEGGNLRATCEGYM